MWFQTEEPGLFLGQCAEYCGTQHANMLIRVVVDPPDEFERWLANEAQPAVEDAADARWQGGVPRPDRASTVIASAGPRPRGATPPT